MSPLLALAALASAPASAADTPPPAWPCPAAPCTWAADNRYLPLTDAVIASAAAPYTFPVPAGATVVGLVVFAPQPIGRGKLGHVRWDPLPDSAGTPLFGGRQLASAGELPDAFDAFPIPIGTGTVSGSVTPLYATLLALTVPEGATSLVVTGERRQEIAVLAAEAWADPQAFPAPWTPEHPVADATWTPWPLQVDETLSVPRPAALGPLGPIAGRVRREGGELRDDAGPVRFYGTNLHLDWSVPPPADSERLAVALASLGFNYVRLGIFPVSRSALYDGGEPRLPTDEEWDNFDALLDAFARNGIRIQIPLVENNPQWGVKSVEAQVDQSKTTYLYPFVDDAARDEQKRWLRAFLRHENRRRGCALADDPVLLVAEIANESGILRAWTAGVYEMLSPAWNARIQAKWNDWLRLNYADDAAITASWTGGVNDGLLPGETLGTIAVAPETPSRWGLWPANRRRDLAVFHAELDAAYYADMTRFLREDLGVGALIEGTQYMSAVTASRIQSVQDIGDTHYQYDHPGGSPQEQQRRPLTELPVDRGLRILVQEAVDGQPFFVSEYNHGWPSPYEYESPFLFATLGARQGWSAMSWFIWRHGPWSPEGPGRIEGQMDIAANPTKIGQLPIAAAILRGGLVPPAEARCVSTLGDSAPDDPRFPIPAPSAGLGDGQGLLDCRHRVVYPGPDTIVPPSRPGAPGPAVWDDANTLVVDTPGVSLVVTDGDQRSTPFLQVGGAPGAIGVVGLDVVPLATARRWLLTVGTRAVNSGHREAGAFTITNAGEAPVLLAPWLGDLVLRGKNAPVVTRLGPDGQPAGVVPVKKTRGGWRVNLGALPPSTWYTVAWE